MTTESTTEATRMLVGLVTATALLGVVALSVCLFRGDLTNGLSITVVSPRAGLVLTTDAKVKLHGVAVGRVTAIDSRPDGTAAIGLTIDQAHADLLPANIGVDIASPTAFGAKSVELVTPAHPAEQRLTTGQVIDAQHVMVEINTVFDQLTSVLRTIAPEKLNATLSALGRAVSGRGQTIAQSITDIDTFLATTDPALPALRHDLAVAPTMLSAYADASPDILTVLGNTAAISTTIVDTREDLDALLINLIGLADTGTPVLDDNDSALGKVLELLVPTTELTDQYNAALFCQITAMARMAHADPSPVPGVQVLAGITAGQERYRYPGDLPKVAATGGPRCDDLPVPFNGRPRWVVADTGSNPWKYGNQNIQLNTDSLKQWLFGPLDGPPRNTAQIGQPG